MNRRELFRQMRAAQYSALPQRIDDVSFFGLWGRLVVSLVGVAVRVGVLMGLCAGTLALLATALLDRHVWRAPGQLLVLWLVLCGAHAVLATLVGLAGAMLLLVWMLLRGQLRHRRYAAAVLAGMVAAAGTVAVSVLVWGHAVARPRGVITASMGEWILLALLVGGGVWIGHAVHVVVALWLTHGIEPPLAPRDRRRSAVWRGAILATLGLVLALDLNRQHVAGVPATDARVAETLSLSRDCHVILLGIDGLGWADVRAGIDEGSLQNWDTLERTGGRGRLYSTSGHGPAAFWITVATGVTPPHHGVRSLEDPRLLRARRPLAVAGEHAALQYLYTQVLHAAGLSDLVPVSRHSVRRWCAWEVVRQAAGEAGVIGWWGAWPGRGEAGIVDMQALMQGGGGDASPLETDARVGEALRATLHRSPRPSLTMAYLPGLDLLARAHQGEPAPEQLDAHRRFLDALIGEVAASLGPEDLLLVVGDRGGRRLDAPLLGLPREEDGGIMLAFGAGIEPATRIARPRAEDVWPTVAWWLGLPPAADVDGRAWVSLRPALALVPAIASYGRPARDGTLDAASVARRRRHLRDAGYLQR